MSLPAVLFVLPQTSASANGGIASISEIISRLERHRPIVVTNRPGAQLDRWREAGIETHVLPISHRRSDPIGTARTYLRYARELRRLVKRSGARVIHANNPMALQLALPAARLTGARLVLNLRDTRERGQRPSRSRFRFLFSAADHLLFLSEDMADRWAEVAANARGKFTVTYSIVDLDRFQPEPRAEGPPVVLVSGIVREKKGQLDFLRKVAPELAAAGIQSWLAGDFDPCGNADMRACAEAAEPLGEAVRFLGYRTDIPELMARSSVVAVPSRHEGLVRAMIEAMACARPVVSFDVASAREMLEERSGGAGTVVAGGDHQAMADALIGYCRDPARAAEAGASGRAAAERLFDPEAVVIRYERVYEALHSGRLPGETTQDNDERA